MAGAAFVMASFVALSWNFHNLLNGPLISKIFPTYYLFDSMGMGQILYPSAGISKKYLTYQKYFLLTASNIRENADCRAGTNWSSRRPSMDLSRR